MGDRRDARTAVWVERLEDGGLFVVLAAMLGWSGLVLMALLDRQFTAAAELIVASAQPAQWLLPLAAVGLILQVAPRALTGMGMPPDRRSWRVRWPAAFFTLLVGVFIAAAIVAATHTMFAGSLYVSAGNLVFYGSLAFISGGFAALGWTAVGLFKPEAWEEWSDLDEEGSA